MNDMVVYLQQGDGLRKLGKNNNPAQTERQDVARLLKMRVKNGSPLHADSRSSRLERRYRKRVKV
jgi:hypothetical protein